MGFKRLMILLIFNVMVLYLWRRLKQQTEKTKQLFSLYFDKIQNNGKGIVNRLNKTLFSSFDRTFQLNKDFNPDFAFACFSHSDFANVLVKAS